jgi:hypothetical protein
MKNKNGNNGISPAATLRSIRGADVRTPKVMPVFGECHSLSCVAPKGTYIYRALFTQLPKNPKKIWIRTHCVLNKNEVNGMVDIGVAREFWSDLVKVGFSKDAD